MPPGSEKEITQRVGHFSRNSQVQDKVRDERAGQQWQQRQPGRRRAHRGGPSDVFQRLSRAGVGRIPGVRQLLPVHRRGHRHPHRRRHRRRHQRRRAWNPFQETSECEYDH